MDPLCAVLKSLAISNDDDNNARTNLEKKHKLKLKKALPIKM